MTAAHYELLHSSARPGVTYVLRRGPLLVDHLWRRSSRLLADIEIGVQRLAPALRAAVEEKAPESLISVQIATTAFAGVMAAALIESLVIRVDGWRPFSVPAEELTAGGAPPELVAEIGLLAFARVSALQEPPAAAEVIQ